MKKLILICLLSIFQLTVNAQVADTCLFTLNYTQASCFNAQPSQVILTLTDVDGNMKDHLTVNYAIGQPGPTQSLNGIIQWDGILTPGNFSFGSLDGITESCILTSQITDICEGGATSTGPIQSVPINYKEPAILNCDEALACFLADIDSYIKIDTLKTVDGLDSIVFNLGGTIYNWVDTDTWVDVQYDLNGNGFIVDQDGDTLWVKTDFYNEWVSGDTSYTQHGDQIFWEFSQLDSTIISENPDTIRYFNTVINSNGDTWEEFVDLKCEVPAQVIEYNRADGSPCQEGDHIVFSSTDIFCKPDTVCKQTIIESDSMYFVETVLVNNQVITVDTTNTLCIQVCEIECQDVTLDGMLTVERIDINSCFYSRTSIVGVNCYDNVPEIVNGTLWNPSQSNISESGSGVCMVDFDPSVGWVNTGVSSLAGDSSCDGIGGTTSSILEAIFPVQNGVNSILPMSHPYVSNVSAVSSTCTITDLELMNRNDVVCSAPNANTDMFTVEGYFRLPVGSTEFFLNGLAGHQYIAAVSSNGTLISGSQFRGEAVQEDFSFVLENATICDQIVFVKFFMYDPSAAGGLTVKWEQNGGGVVSIPSSEFGTTP